MPQDIRVSHRCPAGSAPARRVTCSADMSHSSHYDPKTTRRVFGDVSLNCDDDRYLLRQGSHLTMAPFRTCGEFSHLMWRFGWLRGVSTALVVFMLVCGRRVPRQH